MQNFRRCAMGVITALIVAGSVTCAFATPLTPFRYESQAQRHCPADVIVWLDLPLLVKLGRLVRRSWRRVRTREVLWNGNVETWRDVFVGRDAVLIHPLRTHHRSRRGTLARPDFGKIVRLRTPEAVERWLAEFPHPPSLR